MTLYLYFARRFTMSFLGVFGIFLMLDVLLNMIDVLRRYSGTDAGAIDILTMISLNLPRGIYPILPLIMILATLKMFLSLSRSSELVVTRSAGRSALRSLTSPVLVAILIGVMTVAVFNPILAATTKKSEVMKNRFLKGTESVLSISREGLWLRQGSRQGQTVIRAQRANLDGTELFDVTFVGFAPDGLPSFRIEAESSRLTPGAWLVKNAKEWRFQDGQNAELNAVTRDQMRVPTNLTGEQIRNGFGAPDTIPIWELAGFIRQLERAGLSTRRHKVWFQAELSKPLMLAVMVLIGAGFTMRHTRFGHAGIMVLLALLMGTSLFFVRNFAQILSENGQIPIILAAWAPPIAGILLAFGLLLHMEDG
ncbi:MAG: LPS export ABC transporter permease LptG [Paracoccaceae bacterium]